MIMNVMKSRTKQREIVNEILNDNKEVCNTQYLDIDINHEEEYIDLIIEGGTFSISTRDQLDMLVTALHKSFENLNGHES